jgi:hypothetical protein
MLGWDIEIMEHLWSGLRGVLACHRCGDRLGADPTPRLSCTSPPLDVERTFAWLSTWRRRAFDYEVLPSSEEAWMYAAMIRITLRRLAQNSS